MTWSPDLNLLPAGIGVGMGVVDVRSERLPEIDEIEALAIAGAAIVSPDRIALNPDCGAPGFGEPPSIDGRLRNSPALPPRLVAPALWVRVRPQA